MLHLTSLLWIAIALVTRPIMNALVKKAKVTLYYSFISYIARGIPTVIHFYNNTEQASESTCIKGFYKRLGSSLQ